MGEILTRKAFTTGDTGEHRPTRGLQFRLPLLATSARSGAPPSMFTPLFIAWRESSRRILYTYRFRSGVLDEASCHSRSFCFPPVPGFRSIGARAEDAGQRR